MAGTDTDTGTDTSNVVEDRGDDFVPTTGTPGEQAPERVETNGEAAKKAVARTELKDQAATTGDEPEPVTGDEPAATGEEAEAAEAEAEAAKGKKDTRIPLARHTAVLEKERAARQAAEQRLAAYEGSQKISAVNQDITAAENNLSELTDKYNAALADGELKQASTLMKEIRTTERNIIEARSDLKIAAMQSQALEQGRFEVAVERIEQAYPQLNPDNEEAYDPVLSGKVLRMMGAYQRDDHMTPTQAMQQAVKDLVTPATVKQADAIAVTPNAPAAKPGAERKADAVKKVTDALQRTPPSLNKVGLDSDAAGGVLTADRAIKMSQKEFSKLGEESLAKLRGDVIA